MKSQQQTGSSRAAKKEGGEEDTTTSTFFSSLEGWHDDARMRKMFGPLPSTRESDEEAWDDLLHFWESALYAYLRHHKQLVFSTDQVKRAFKRNNVVPQSLEQVVAELMAQKKMVTKEDFMTRQGWLAWMGSLVLGPLRWGWSSKTAQVELVCLRLLQELAESLWDTHHASSCFAIDHVVPLKELVHRQQKEDLPLSQENVLLLCAYLQHTNRLSLFVLPNGEKAVKFASQKQKHSQAVSITQADKGIVQLKLAMAAIEQQEASLSKEIEGCVKQALQLNKNATPHNLGKSKALAQLRRKKRLQSLLEKRMGTYETLRQMLETIQQVQTDKEILEQYKEGVATIKAIREKEGLTAEAVDDVMEDLAEVFADQREVDEAFTQGNDQLTLVDEDELEKELAELLGDTVPRQSTATPIAAASTAAADTAEDIEQAGSLDGWFVGSTAARSWHCLPPLLLLPNMALS
ncbi:Charged multivesicular body protein 7 [Balamuthia mandrillaris]